MSAVRRNLKKARFWEPQKSLRVYLLFDFPIRGCKAKNQQLIFSKIENPGIEDFCTLILGKLLDIRTSSTENKKVR